MVTIISDRPFPTGKMEKKREQMLIEEAMAQMDIDGLLLELNESPREPDVQESAIRSIARTKQQMYDIVHSNPWDLFITVTFDPKKVDRYDYSEVAKKFSQLIKDIKRRKCPNLEYIFVVEHHTKGVRNENGDMAFHFHGLLRGIDGLTLKKALRAKSAGIKGYQAEITNKSGLQVYNMPDFNLGWAEATYVTDTAKASNYLLKYITKDLVKTLGESKKRYWSSQGLNRTIKTDLMLSMKEQGELVKILSESKMTVSAKTVNVEKDGYTNRLTYIVYQDMSENQDVNSACWKNLCKSVALPAFLKWDDVLQQTGCSMPWTIRPEEKHEEYEEYEA